MPHTLHLLLLFLLPPFACQALVAQSSIMYDPEIGGYYYIGGDRVNLREGPSTDLGIAAVLQPGDSVRLLRVTNVLFTQKGMEYPWVEVTCTKGNTRVHGYVWSGLLSFAREQIDTRNTLYLVPGYFDAATHQLYGEARLVRDTKITSHAEFRLHVFDTLHPRLEMFVYPALREREVHGDLLVLPHLLSIESCGPTGVVYVMVQNERIVFCASSLGYFSGDSYSEGNSFVFPWDSGGVKGIISEYYHYYESDGEESVKDTTWYLGSYRWRDNQFQRQ